MDKFYNASPDYTQEAASKLISEGKIQDTLLEKIDPLIHSLKTKLDDHVSKIKSSGDCSVYTGYSGVALAYFLIHQVENDSNACEVAFTLASKAVKSLKGKRVSFLNGDAGPLALLAVLNQVKGEKEAAKVLIQRLVVLGENIPKDTPDEILYGRAGYLYSLLFVNQHIKGAIPDSVIRLHVESILKSGQDLAKKNNSHIPLNYEWHDKNYLGAAHGVAGILYILLVSRHLTESELNELIRPTLDCLCTMRFKSGNLKSSETSGDDRLVQWCHGSPGFTSLLIRASEVFDSNNYMLLALESGDVTWKRGLLKKGYSICHGVCGNAYAFLALYKKTKDEKHLFRAASFVQWTLKYPEHQGMDPDRPYSLFEGIAGIIYFLTDVKQLYKSAFPAYEINEMSN